MATVQLNPAFDGLSKGMGNIVFYRARGKTMIRRRAVVNNPDTPAQQKKRSAFREAVQAWQCLDITEKERRKGRLSINAS